MSKSRSRAQREKDKLRKRQTRALVNASFIYHPVDGAWRVNIQQLLTPGPSQLIDGNTSRQLQIPESVGIRSIRGDGNCFFNSLSYVIFGDQRYNTLLRERICDHLEHNIDDLRGYLPEQYRNNVQEYIQTSGMRTNGTWATEVEIFTASHLLHTDIYLYTLSGQRWVWLRHRTINTVGDSGIYLYHANQNHFDVVVGNSDTQVLDTFTLKLQQYFEDKSKEQVEPTYLYGLNKSPLPQKARESRKYHTDKEFKDKKKQQSKEWANNKYQTDASFQQNKKTQQSNRYNTDWSYRNSTKTRSKNRSKNLYDTDLNFRDNTKTRSKNRSNNLYHTDANFRENKKAKEKNVYQTNVEKAKRLKAKLRLKYKADKVYRYNKKLCERIRYSKVSAYRLSKMLKSKKRYASNLEFKDKVKTYSRNKYARFDSFRRNLKTSSVKKYSSNPLFRTKLKEFLRQQYHNDIEIRLKKLESVTERRKCIATAIRTFQKSISDLPVYTCTVCIRGLYKSQVKKCNRSKYMQEGKLTENAEKCLKGKYVHECTEECVAKCPFAQEWICFTCHRHLSAMNMPPQAQANGLDLVDIPPELQRLNSLEKHLVALRLPFMKIVSLPKGGQKGVKGPVINVPSDVEKVATTLPRTPNESQLIRVKLKRKLSYKGHHEYEWINPQNVREAVEYLKQYNKWYADVQVTDDWFDEVLDRDIVRGACEALNSTSENNGLTLDDSDSEATIITDETTDNILPSQMSVDEFEAYSLEKIGKNVKEAAKLLEEMFLAFPNEQRLWTEVHSILDALQSDSTNNSFLTEIFAALTTPTQCQMLVTLSNKMTDILEQCRLLLLAMKKFTSLVNEHGLKLVGTLLKAEWDAKLKTPVNCYRKLLVCDVLPLVLHKKKKFELPDSQFYNWLQLAVEFYVMYITQTPVSPAGSPNTPELLSPTKTNRRVSISGLLDKECQITDPWENLQKLVSQIGDHLNWDLDKAFFSQSRDIQCQQVLSLHHRSQQMKNVHSTKQVLYTTVVVFLESLYSYVSSVDPDSFIGSLSLSEPLVMVEGLKLELSDEPSPSKKFKSTIAPPILSPPCFHQSKTVIQCFTTAFKCYELLYSTAELQREFQVLCKAWKLETWTWMSHFQTDMLLFQGAYNEAVEHLHSFSSTMKDKMKIRSNLQMACCYHCLGKYNKVCELVLDTISGFKESNQFTVTDQSQIDVPDSCQRHLVLTLCNETEIVPYCIQLLISSLKEKVFSAKYDDVSIGHLIILFQYDWPKNESLFQHVIKKIKSQGSLTYTIFFNYVINIDILEEFSLLKSVEGGKVNLDILPISTKALAQQRTVTRGVNKGVKEDFKQMIEKQVKRSDENVNQLIYSFLKEERQYLIDSLIIK